VAVSGAATAFDERDNLREARNADRLRAVLAALVESARQFA
jgi:hypothetical protein